MGERVINWGILAPGKIAAKFAEDLLKVSEAKLVAVGSRNLGRAKAFAAAFDAEKSYGSYEELLADERVEVVYIASPHPQHYQHTLDCLEAGKAVLCEKPACMNANQLKKVLETAEKKSLFYMEALWTRFLPSYEKAIKLIEEPFFGEPTLLTADFSVRVPFDKDSRLFNPALGGGSLLDIGIYPVFLRSLYLESLYMCRPSLSLPLQRWMSSLLFRWNGQMANWRALLPHLEQMVR